MDGEFRVNEKCGASGNHIMRADGEFDEKGSNNTIIFINVETGVGECYEPEFLYEAVRGARRLWMFEQGSKNKDYRYPVFKLSFTGILVDYVTMGMALHCGVNTILLYKKEKRDIYSTGLAVGSKHGTENVYFGSPIRRKTYFSMKINDMKEDARKFQKGKLELSQNDLSEKPNWAPIPNNNEVFQDDIDQAQATAEYTIFENYKQAQGHFIRNALRQGKSEEQIEDELKMYFKNDDEQQQDVQELAREMIDEVLEESKKDRGFLFPID